MLKKFVLRNSNPHVANTTHIQRVRWGHKISISLRFTLLFSVFVDSGVYLICEAGEGLWGGAAAEGFV